MTWLLILGLLVWCFVLMSQLSSLKVRVGALERRQGMLVSVNEDERADAAARAPVPPPAAASSAPEPPPLALEPAPNDEIARPRIPAPRATPSQPQVRAWLEENGLAWAGGIVLALGGLFLVAYAAQRGLFTPAFRIAAAVLAGGSMLGASEWLRRQLGQADRGHGLAAAVAAGAGAATLYGAAWGSYWLYAFISLPLAGALMALISFGLLGLSFRHGEPLAVLAIVGGFLAPMVTGPQHWAAPALTADLALITATGYLVAGVRRWGNAGMATLLGAAVWAVAGFAAEGYVRVAALAVAPAAFAYLAVEWRRRRGDSAAQSGWTDFTQLPNAALATGSALLLALWLAPMTPQALPAATVGAAVMAGLAALGARRGLLADRVQPLGYAPVAGAALPFLRHVGAPDAREHWAGALMLIAPGAGLWSALGARTPGARLGASAGAVAALLIALATSGPLTAHISWAPAASLAILLVAFAGVLARASATPNTDLPLAIWIWAAGAAAMYALPRAFEPRLLPIAAAALATLAASLHRRLGWRGFAAVSIAAALTSLAALFRPAVFKALDDGDLRWWSLIAVAGASAALVYASSRLAARPDRPREASEALSTGSLLIVLSGLFLVLRQQGMADATGGGTLDPFFEASLRSVLILAAGLLSAQSASAESSTIGRWRGQVLLLVGLAHCVFFQLLVLNPLVLHPLGLHWQPRVAGPRLFDSLAVGFLAPALLLGAATVKKVSIRRELLAIYAVGAALLGVVWSLLETRRLFQGGSLHAGLDAIGRAEACAYAIIVLVVARAILWAGDTASRRTWTISSVAGEAIQIGRAASWPALGVALFVFAFGASPWWGPIDRPLGGHWAAALLFAGYAFGILAAGSLIRATERLGAQLLARVSRITAVVIAFALLNILIRYAFHGLDMHAGLQEMSLETWAFSAAWGLFGVGLLVFGVARLSNDLRGAGLLVLLATTAKIFLFDMARLEGVVRAGSFLAVGALLLGAAVLVRRLGGSTLSMGRRDDRSPTSNEV